MTNRITPKTMLSGGLGDNLATYVNNYNKI